MEDRRKSIVRSPLVLFVDGLELEPEVSMGVTRTSYDLEITEYDMRKLQTWISKRLQQPIITPLRVRVIGRLV